MSAPAQLYLLPAPLSEDTPPEAVVPGPVLLRIRALDRFVVENAKSARAWLAACAHPKPIREISISELNEHTPASQVPVLLEPLVAGHDVGCCRRRACPPSPIPAPRSSLPRTHAG